MIFLVDFPDQLDSGRCLFSSRRNGDFAFILCAKLSDAFFPTFQIRSLNYVSFLPDEAEADVIIKSRLMPRPGFGVAPTRGLLKDALLTELPHRGMFFS